MDYKAINTVGLNRFIQKNKTENHILTPATRLYKNGLIISFTQLKLDSNIEPGQNSNDDYWSLEGQKFFLTKSSIEKISNAARLSFIDSRLVDREVDDSKRAVFVKQQIYFEYLFTDGFKRKSTATGEYCFCEDCERLKFADDVYEAEQLIGKKGEQNTELINMRRRSSGLIAESNAKGRALMEVFPILKKPFKLYDLQKPFLIGTVVPDTQRILKANPHLQDSYYAGILDIKTKMFAS